MTILWNEVTILWNEVTIWWNEVTKGWNEVVWNEVVMERRDRIPVKYKLTVLIDINLITEDFLKLLKVGCAVCD